jgi:hypothetical protein
MLVLMRANDGAEVEIEPQYTSDGLIEGGQIRTTEP